MIAVTCPPRNASQPRTTPTKVGEVRQHFFRIARRENRIVGLVEKVAYRIIRLQSRFRRGGNILLNFRISAAGNRRNCPPNNHPSLHQYCESPTGTATSP